MKKVKLLKGFLIFVSAGVLALLISRPFKTDVRATTASVCTFEEFQNAVANEGISTIELGSDIDFLQSIEIVRDLSITSSGDYIINVASSFLEIGKDAELTISTETGSITLQGDDQTTYISPVITNKGVLNLGENVSITGFKSNNVSGSAVYSSGTLNLDGTIIYNNNLSVDEGVKKYGIIYLAEGSSCNIESGEIYNNSTLSTGIIFVHNNVDLIVDGGKVYNNSTTANGGAFYVKSANITINDCEIYDNSAENGGAFYCGDSAEVIFNDGKIYQNTSSSYGAGSYITSKAKFTMNGGEVYENTSTKSGGAFFASLSDGQASTLTINDGKIYSNKSTSGNGGFVNSKANVVINGGKISGNIAKKGAGIYAYDSGSLTINGGEISENVASGDGGGVYVTKINAVITGGKIVNNSSANGGGILVYDSANVKILNGEIKNNTATTRGADIYCAASGDTKATTYPTLTLLGGDFGAVHTQYSLIEIGGDLKCSSPIKFWAGVQAKYAYIKIVKEIENEIVLDRSSYSVESSTTTNRMIRYDVNDPYSNIYRTVNRLAFANNAYEANVLGDSIIYAKKNKAIDVSANENVLTVPKSATATSVVAFKALNEYNVSNLTITKSAGGDVDFTLTDGVYQFTMPDDAVTISYDYEKRDLGLTIDESFANIISTEKNSYKFKDDVVINEKNPTSYKLTKLFATDGKYEQQIDLDDALSFKMFNNAKLCGEYLSLHEISTENTQLIKSVTFLGDASGKKACSGDTIKFSVNRDTNAENLRFVLVGVYYYDSGMQKVDILKNQEGFYEFTMPDYDIEVKFEFEDVLLNIEGEKVFVATEQDLIDALKTNKIVVLVNDITLTQTLSIKNGTHTILAIQDCSLVRGVGLKRNMIELGWKATLNLNLEDYNLTNLTIDGNGANVTGVVGSAIFLADNSVLNMYNSVYVKNNKLNNVNYLYTELGYGNSQCGGSAIFNSNGIVNMYGGEICNNSSSYNGGAVYNYGRFNLYGGKITNNKTTTNGAGVYNIRIFNQEGGEISNNVCEGTGYGAGIYNAKSSYAYYYLLGGKVTKNIAEKSGAGLFNGENSTVWIKGGEFSENQTSNNGGAINNKGYLFVLDGEFKNNTAVKNGGAIFTYGDHTLYIRGGSFDSNTANNGGAIALNETGHLEISGGEFKNNVAVSRGGAIYLYSDSKTNPTSSRIKNVSISGNSATDGNGICVQYSVLALGSGVNIEDDVKLVAKTTSDCAYFVIEDLLDYEITFAIKYPDEANIFRLKNVEATDIISKLKLADQTYETAISNGTIDVQLKQQG